MQRRFRLPLLQWVGMPLILAIPILALFNVFGETRRAARSSGRDLDIRVEYPTRVRYGATTSLDVWVRNHSDRPLDTVALSFDTAYIAHFANPVYVPPPIQAHELKLLDLRPAEVRLATLELRPEESGRHSGRVTAASHGDSVAVVFRTFVLP